jgi:hypothetical protein
MPVDRETDPKHSKTDEIGWVAVRDVPCRFENDILCAEAATMRWLQEGDRLALDKAVLIWERIHDSPDFTSFSVAFRLDVLNRAAIACFSCGEARNSLEDIQRAASLWNKALEWTPEGWPEKFIYQHNIGSLYLARYHQTGSMTEVDKAIDLLRHVESQCSKNDRNFFLYVYSLETALAERYERRGSLEDLDASIKYGEITVATAPRSTDRYAMCLAELGRQYRKRFLRSAEVMDIERSVELLSGAVHETRLKTSLPARVTDLGNALLERFEFSRNSVDIEAAIENQRKALELTEPGSRSMARRLNNLGNALVKRYDVNASKSDLEASIKAYRQCLELTSSVDPLITSRLFNLANALRRLAELEAEPLQYQEVTEVFRRACAGGADFSLEWTVAASQAWGRWASRRGAWKEAAEAFRYGLGALGRLYSAQLLPSNKISWLKDYRNLATEAAYALAKTENLIDAVITVENSRTRALSEALASKTMSIDAARPEDKRDWLRQRAQIVELQSEAGLTWRQGQRDLLDITTDLRRAHEAIDETVARIRQYLPGFLPVGLSIPDLTNTVGALKRPLTYVLTVEQGSLALIVASDQSSPTCRVTVTPVWLPKFTSGLLQRILSGTKSAPGYLDLAILERIDTRQQVLDDALSLLRQNVITPLVESLNHCGYKAAVLVPVGLLSIIPLHGVGLDCVMSNAPSGRALLWAMQTFRERGQFERRFLGITNPLPQERPLDYAESETEAIAQEFDRDDVGILYGPQATREEIKRRIGQAVYVHFACHGAFNLAEPLSSKLWLAGGDSLTLQDLLSDEFDLSHARLVALSACQSGITEFEKVPDEAIGMPAAFMQAGCPGVVSSLWPVDDLSTAVLMTQFYKLHLDSTKGLDLSTALHEAQEWLRRSNAKELGLANLFAKRYEASRRSDADAFAWMAYYQAKPETKPFEHPYFWAGFFFAGV